MDEVKLRIRSPCASHPDVELHINTAAQVAEVKRRIEAEYASHPPPSHQKLVYAGKLLADNMVLADFLRFEDECSVYNIHLVCKVIESVVDNSTTTTSTQLPATSQNNRPNASQSNAMGDDGLRNRFQTNHTFPPPPSTTTTASAIHVPAEQPFTTESNDLNAIQTMLESLGAASAGMGQPGLEAEEMASLQQIYAQYINLYAQYTQSLTTNAASVAVTPEQAHLPPAADRLQAPPAAAAAAAPPPPAVAPGGGVGGAMEAGGEPEAENAGNNDMLDYAYAIIRVMILLCIMYVHSSFFRLLFVVIGMGLIYLFQNRNPRGAVPAANNNQRREINNNAENGGENNAGVVEAEDDNVEAETADPAELVAAAEPKPNILVIAFTFVTSFISSIIPDANNVI